MVEQILAYTKQPLFELIDFDLTGGQTTQEGRLTWNADRGTLNVGLPGGNVNVQIGQEGVVPVRNESGSDIKNGELVYATGAIGQRLTIDLVDNTDADTIWILGMATEDVDNNANGYVALWGDVSGDATQPIDTSAYAEGTKLYATTAGGWDSTHPSVATSATILIGIVQRQHATEGRINLNIHPFTIGNNYDGTMRQSIINKSAGTSAAVGFTAVNDLGHYTTVGIAGSNNSVFTNEVSIHYAPGYGDHWQAVDGAKDFVWFTDPTDSHNNSSLSYERMRLKGDTGRLGIGTGTPYTKLEIDGGITANDGTYAGTYDGLAYLSNDARIYCISDDGGVWGAGYVLGANSAATGAFTNSWSIIRTSATDNLAFKFGTNADGISNTSYAQLVAGDAFYLEDGLKANFGGNDMDSFVKGLTDDNLTYWDASTNRVGIGTATPATKLDVVGDITSSATVFADRLYAAGNGLTNTAGSYINYDLAPGTGTTNYVNHQGAGTVGGFAWNNTTNATSGTPLAALTGTGLGLGDFSVAPPSYPLHIKSTATNQIYIEDGTDWASFDLQPGTFYIDTSEARIDLKGTTFGSAGSTYFQDIGANASGDRTVFIDFVAEDTVYPDFGLRIIRNGGANGAATFQHRGTGTWNFNKTEGGIISINSSGADTDVQIEGDTFTNLFRTDAGLDRVGINTASPETLFHVAQTDSAAGLSVVKIDQADVDKPFIQYEGTAAAATLNNSIVDDDDVTTATLVGWVKVFVTDNGNQISDQSYYQPIYTLA
jgi:hypothetical protein